MIWTAITKWVRGNPLWSAVILLLVALAIYKGQASYYKGKAEKSAAVVKSQGEAINTVGKANETRNSVNSLSGVDVHDRLYKTWCRDC